MHLDRPMAPQTGASEPDPFPIPARTFLRPPVVVEVVLGVSPLVGVVWFRWDMYLMLMLHLLAIAVSGTWLALRTLVLSRKALVYFNPQTRKPVRGPLPGARFLFAGLTVLGFGVPMFLLAGVISDEFGGAWRAQMHRLGDFFRLVVIGAGLWIPLAFVCAWEAASFAADVLLPLSGRFETPARTIAPAYRSLSRELQAFLYVRAFAVLRLIVTVLAVGAGVFAGQLFGIAAVAVVLVLFKTAVAVFLEAGAIVDAENEAKRRAGRPTP